MNAKQGFIKASDSKMGDPMINIYLILKTGMKEINKCQNGKQKDSI